MPVVFRDGDVGDVPGSAFNHGKQCHCNWGGMLPHANFTFADVRKYSDKKQLVGKKAFFCLLFVLRCFAHNSRL